MVVAYLLTISQLPWQRCLSAIQKVRPIANPNFGFRSQLKLYEKTIRLSRKRDGEQDRFNVYDEREIDMKHLQALTPSKFPTILSTIRK